MICCSRWIYSETSSPSSDYRQLLTSPELGERATSRTFRASRDEVIGEPQREPRDWVRRKSVFKPVLIDGEHRAGVLTHPYLLERFGLS